MKKIGKLIYCALGAALVLTGCGKKDSKGEKKFGVKSEESYYYVYSTLACEQHNIISTDTSGLNDQYRTEYEYDKNHNVVKEKYLEYSTEIFDYYVYSEGLFEYDEKGNMTCEEYFDYDLEGEVTGRCKYVYSKFDDHGYYQEYRYYEYSSDDKFTKPYLSSYNEYSFEYDENGNMTKETYINRYGDTYISLYTYDELGRELTYMYSGNIENFHDGYSFYEKTVYTYFEGSDSNEYKTCTYYYFENGVWVESIRYEAEMDEEGYIYKESSIYGDVVTYYWEVEKVSDTEIVEKAYELDSYDAETKEATYILDYKNEVEYRNHEELLNDGDVVSRTYKEYYEGGERISYMFKFDCSYDENGNYLGRERLYYTGSDSTYNDLSLIAVYYESLEYIEF